MPPEISALLGLGSGDFVIPDAFPMIERILAGGMQPPLPGSVVLDAVEVAAVRATTAAYNAVIEAEALAYGAVHVDVHRLLNQLDGSGIVIDGQPLTTGFLGGIFSLDGVHPTNTGYALVANEFLRALSASSLLPISLIDVPRVMRADPLVPHGIGPVATLPNALAGPPTAALRAVYGPR